MVTRKPHTRKFSQQKTPSQVKMIESLQESRQGQETQLKDRNAGAPWNSYYPNSSKTRERRNNSHSPRYSTCCMHGINEIINDLQAGTLDFHTAKQQGLFPLHVAVACGLLDCAESLILLGAELNLETDQGLTPVEVAVMAGNFEAAALLIHHGASVERIRDGMPLYSVPTDKRRF